MQAPLEIPKPIYFDFSQNRYCVEPWFENAA